MSSGLFLNQESLGLKLKSYLDHTKSSNLVLIHALIPSDYLLTAMPELEIVEHLSGRVKVSAEATILSKPLNIEFKDLVARRRGIVIIVGSSILGGLLRGKLKGSKSRRKRNQHGIIVNRSTARH